MTISDDQRQAASLKVGITTYVGSATLALIGGAAALFTYVQQNFVASIGFYFLMSLSVLVLVASFVLGGKGANATVAKLAEGSWTAATKISEFNSQAILTLIGLVLILVAIVFGTLSPLRQAQKDPCNTMMVTQLSSPHVDVTQLSRDVAACESDRSS